MKVCTLGAAARWVSVKVVRQIFVLHLLVKEPWKDVGIGTVRKTIRNGGLVSRPSLAHLVAFR
jgi:hypothetical protein